MEFKQIQLVLDKKIDQKTRRHYINGTNVVLHCHHYSTLYTQLALDADETDLLVDVGIEVFYNELVNYFETYGIDCVDEKIEIACQMYAAMGLGKMVVKSFGPDSGVVEVLRSHVDEGWIKKWGNHNEPVNYIGAAFCNAFFAAVNDVDPKSFTANEISSLAMGDEKCVFKVVKA